MTEENMEKFCSITDSDEATAIQYLSMCSNNLEMAISLFMDSSHNHPNTIPQTSTDSPHVRAPIPQKSEVLVNDEPVLPRVVVRPRRQYNGNRPIFGSVMISDDDEEEESPVLDLTDESNGSRESASRQTLALPGTSRSSPRLNHLQSAPDRPEIESSKSTAKKRSRLETIFARPKHLLFKGSFKEACDAGKRDNKWVIVNVHDSREFHCHKLNRDVWKNVEIARIVEQYFLLWQVDRNSEDAQYYIQFYPYKSGPYLAIIDPLTKELKAHWNDLIDAKKVQEAFSEFLSSHQLHPTRIISIDEDTNSSLNLHQEPMDIDSDSGLPPKRAKKDECNNDTKTVSSEVSSVHLLSEEEQLRMALEASRKEFGFNNGETSGWKKKKKTSGNHSKNTAGSKKTYVVVSDSDEVEILSDEFDSCTQIQTSSNTSSPTKSVQNGYPSSPHSSGAPCKPASSESDANQWESYLGDPNSEHCHLLVRLPSGKRETLSFPLDSKLKALILYFESQGFVREVYELVRTHPLLNLTDNDLNATLKELGFSKRDTIFLQER